MYNALRISRWNKFWGSGKTNKRLLFLYYCLVVSEAYRETQKGGVVEKTKCLKGGGVRTAAPPPPWTPFEPHDGYALFDGIKALNATLISRPCPRY